MPDVRDEIARAALAITRRVHDEGFEAVIVSGGSHQSSRSLLALAWGVLYPGEPMLKTFVLDSEGNQLLYKKMSYGKPVYGRTTVSAVRDLEPFEKWMRAHVPELEEFKDKPMVLVDEFALSGEKYHDISSALSELGFTKMRYAFFAMSENLELGHDAIGGVRSREAVAELHRLGQHIQDKPEADEKVRDELEGLMRHYRPEALEELRDIGRRMK